MLKRTAKRLLPLRKIHVILPTLRPRVDFLFEIRVCEISPKWKFEISQLLLTSTTAKLL